MLTAISRGAGKGQCPQRRIHDARCSTALAARKYSQKRTLQYFRRELIEKKVNQHPLRSILGLKVQAFSAIYKPHYCLLQ